MKIIGTPHDINQYYTLMGREFVFTGMVYHDDGFPTSTNVDCQPLFITKKAKIEEQLIEKYQKHFDHTVERFEKEYTLYESDDLKV